MSKQKKRKCRNLDCDNEVVNNYCSLKCLSAFPHVAYKMNQIFCATSLEEFYRKFFIALMLEGPTELPRMFNISRPPIYFLGRKVWDYTTEEKINAYWSFYVR